jgi:hypothetical protein
MWCPPSISTHHISNHNRLYRINSFPERLSAIATLEQIAGMVKKPLSIASMRTHITQVRALLRGDVADIDGGLARILASDGWLPDRPINVPIYMAGEGPIRALAKEIADGLICLRAPAEGFATCLVTTGGTVLDDGEDVASPRASTALNPLIALAYHSRYTADPESVKALPNGEAWLASVERMVEKVRPSPFTAAITSTFQTATTRSSMYPP